MSMVKIKIIATEKDLSDWLLSHLKPGDIKVAEPSCDDFGYLITEPGKNFGYFVPMDFAEEVKTTSNIFINGAWLDSEEFSRINPYQLILKYDLNEAKALLQRLTTLGINDDVKIGIVNGAWNRTADGFTWNELFQATSDFGLMQFCGGLADAKEKVARALKEGYRCIDIPHEDGFADVLTSSVVKAINRIEFAIGLESDKNSIEGIEAKQSTFNIGDEITAKFKNFLGEELTVKGNIREILTGVLCCNDVISGRSFAVNFDEVLSHTSCLIEVGQVLKGNVSNGSE